MITIGTIRLRRVLAAAAATGTSLFLRNDRSSGPDIEESIDVVGERICRFNGSKNLVKEDVREQRSHEQQRRRAGICDADHSRLMRPPKIAGDDLQTSPRRAVVVAGVERNDERGIRLLVHAQHEVLPDRRFREGNPFFGDAPQNHARIRGSVHVLQIGDACGQLNVAVHRCVEQRLFGIEVPEDGGGGDSHLRRDVGEGGG